MKCLQTLSTHTHTHTRYTKYTQPTTFIPDETQKQINKTVASRCAASHQPSPTHDIELEYKYFIFYLLNIFE